LAGDDKQQYKCECGWIGTENDMRADSIKAPDWTDEMWSNWICPHCGHWAQGLMDYTKVKS